MGKINLLDNKALEVALGKSRIGRGRGNVKSDIRTFIGIISG